MANEVDGGGSCGVVAFQIDEAYEFCAPRFFDFMNEESPEEIQMAELWFETALSYAPSPFMARIKVGRSVQIGGMCDFENVEEIQKESESAVATHQAEDSVPAAPNQTCDSISNIQELTNALEVKGGHQDEPENVKNSFELISENKPCEDRRIPQEGASMLAGISPSSVAMDNLSKDTSFSAFPVIPSSTPGVLQAAEACTPKVQTVTVAGAAPSSLRNQTANKIASQILKTKNQSPALPSMKSIKPKNTTRCPGSVPKNGLATDIAQENQAVKRQKLEGGRSRQIHNVKNRMLPHKSKLGLTSSVMDIFASASKGHPDAAPFISAAEMVKKFESGTRDIAFSLNGSLSQVDTASAIKRRPKLTLTRPKEPELETAHRVRAFRVKSSAELEEEMLAKLPKFKARPVNKKIFEAPSLPTFPRSAPQPPQFLEFHLKTMERANQHAETLSSTEDPSASLNEGKPLRLTEPRPPLLETSLRARPPRAKSTQDLELEELQKMPKFKARPLNKKILESKGDLGLFCNTKRQVTTPQEFHFATNERMGPPTATVVELFDKLSLHSESSHHDYEEVSRITIPNPFCLHTEERGLQKERQLADQILQKQLEEERARIPKANPYPYTTDYPVIPPKPEPKQCTKPEAFQLESLVRHEEEMHKKFEEKERLEKEEAQRRIFRAQPIMKEDPLPVPEKTRKPLTDVQEFVLRVDDRAVHRSEFDKKIKEKQLMYKRLREEYECAKEMEEEKAVKQMRRTMVPHARPVPKFDHPFVPQKSTKETTKPKSPHLQVTHRREERCHTSYLR